MKTIAIRVCFSLVGLIALAAPRGADAASFATRPCPPAVHAAPSAPSADPSIIG